MAYSIGQLEAIGGKLWEKNGKRRIYFNYDLLVEVYGLELERYNSGNICAAWLDGETISNRRAYDISATLRTGKLYYDLAGGTFHGQNMGGLEGRLIKRLQARLDGPAQPPEAAVTPAPVKETPPAPPLPEGYVIAECGHQCRAKDVMMANTARVCQSCFESGRYD